MEHEPSDLIQQALDIMASDNGNVRITTQAPASLGGKVARWDGTVEGITHSMHPELVLSDMRAAGDPVGSGARNHMYIDFASIIDIETIGAS